VPCAGQFLALDDELQGRGFSEHALQHRGITTALAVDLHDEIALQQGAAGSGRAIPAIHDPSVIHLLHAERPAIADDMEAEVRTGAGLL
jgi:hypothetical protein